MKLTSWFLNFDFAGRARRSHWWANLGAWAVVSFFGLIILLAMSIGPAAKQASVGGAIGAVVLIVLAVAAFLDGMAMTFRRAHDTGKSGWVFLLLFIPIINLIPFYWLMIEDSQQGPNKYGAPVKQFYEPATA